MTDRELLEMAAKAAGLPMCEEWGYSGAEKYKLLADIRAALSAGKEGE